MGYRVGDLGFLTLKLMLMSSVLWCQHEHTFTPLDMRLAGIIKDLQRRCPAI